MIFSEGKMYFQGRVFGKQSGSPSYPADTKMETMENVSDMNREQLRKLKTECAIAEKKVEQSQLIDRIATNTFQG